MSWEDGIGHLVKMTTIHQRMRAKLPENAIIETESAVLRCDGCGLRLWAEAPAGVDITIAMMRASHGWEMLPDADYCTECRGRSQR